MSTTGMTKAELTAQIDQARLDIVGIEGEIQGRRGVIEDVLRVVLPLQKQHLHLLEETLKLVSEPLR
jgi:hypothetical protein